MKGVYRLEFWGLTSYQHVIGKTIRLSPVVEQKTCTIKALRHEEIRSHFSEFFVPWWFIHSTAQ